MEIFNTETHTSLVDGTAGCPIVGTLGSYAFYILGIFMATVFLVGPGTSFGQQSQQNPAYWLQLLLFSKQTGTQATWYDGRKEQLCQQMLNPSDFRLWIRFVMSFIINGLGFHILVHALPLQMASQSSLTGVVYKAVGMLYLVNMDDTLGSKITLVPKAIEEVVEKKTNEEMDDVMPEQDSIPGDATGNTMSSDDLTKPALNDGEIATLSQQIIDDARAQLDALLQGRESLPQKRMQKRGSSVYEYVAGGSRQKLRSQSATSQRWRLSRNRLRYSSKPPLMNDVDEGDDGGGEG
jgi:hypothetical protein